MNTWLVIVIVIAVLLVVYFISGFIFAFICLGRKNSVLEELKKLEEYEKNRGSKLIDKIYLLQSSGLKFDNNAIKKMEDYINRFSNLNVKERMEYKNMVDFSAMFLFKVYNEDKKLSKLFNQDEALEFQNYQKDSDLKYKTYNKKAGAYNAFLFMPFCKIALKLMKKDPTPFNVF